MVLGLRIINIFYEVLQLIEGIELIMRNLQGYSVVLTSIPIL